MIKALYLILFSISTLSACTKTGSMTHTQPVTGSPAPAADTLTYLALGDSYTIGQSVPEHDAFPYQLAGQLPGHKITSPTIIARTGWTTRQLISAIDGSSIGGKTYDIVTLLIGVNDQYNGGSQAAYRVNFIEVLNAAIKFAKGNKTRVFVLSIPDYGVTPFAHGDDARIGKEIDQFNDINREESSRAGVNYIDITPISKEAASNKALIAEDGLHPSAIMYGLWVEKLRPVILDVLQNK